MEKHSTSIGEYFSKLSDPRIERSKLHSLYDILVIVIGASICGADNWVAIEMFAKSKEAWFRKTLNLSGDLPSHDALGRVFSLLGHNEFAQYFASWVHSFTG